MIKPGVDASNKELHFRNEFRYAGKNFDKFLSRGENQEDKKGFKPIKLGKHSKVVKNVKVNVKEHHEIDHDFKRNMYGDCGKIEEYEDYQKGKQQEAQ